MKNLFTLFVLLALVGCGGARSPHHPIILDSTSFTEQPEVFSSKLLSILHLDLTKANVTFLTTQVSTASVAAVLADFDKFNSKNNNPIYLILDTPGGSVMDGGRLISAMQASKNPIYAVDVGMAASMGFMILEHAHKRFGVSRAILMAHPASLGIMYQGEVDKLYSSLSFLKRYVDKMDRFIAKRAGMTYEAFKLRSDHELWIDSEDALRDHLLDEVVSVKLPNSNSQPKFGDNILLQNFRME